MRIAQIPPEMWLTHVMQAARPEVVYLGPAPKTDGHTQQIEQLLPHFTHHSKAAFVYVLLHCDAEVVYIGKSRNLVGRFSKHRRREWWSEVHNLLLLRVEGATERDADALAFHVEALLIKRLSPPWNIAGIDERPMNKRGAYL